MNYHTGELIELGDSIDLSSDITGIIVGIIEESKFSSQFPKEEWGYLDRGLLVLSDQAGLIHYPDITEDMKLIKKVK
ncbi:hypothetical protein J537_0569 [Acinetobacter baumannii 1437282]|nr:hypothetical protein J537_0569 [Acinetobacter baumannii 1437282]